MSNELNNIVSRTTNGVYEGVAIGGDRYPGTNFMDHIMRYQRDPEVKMIVLLGEVGGIEEYDVCAALKDGRITKPLVAWCIGTCASKLRVLLFERREIRGIDFPAKGNSWIRPRIRSGLYTKSDAIGCSV